MLIYGSIIPYINIRCGKDLCNAAYYMLNLLSSMI